MGPFLESQMFLCCKAVLDSRMQAVVPGFPNPGGIHQPAGPVFSFPEAQARPESIHAEPFMALISLNAVFLAQHE